MAKHEFNAIFFMAEPKKKWFHFTTPEPQKQLVSIIVTGEEQAGQDFTIYKSKYSALSKRFDLKQAWNKIETVGVFKGGDEGHVFEADYHFRNTVLKLIYNRYIKDNEQREQFPFSYSTMKILFANYGKTEREIYCETFHFCL